MPQFVVLCGFERAEQSVAGIIDDHIDPVGDAERRLDCGFRSARLRKIGGEDVKPAARGG